MCVCVWVWGGGGGGGGGLPEEHLAESPGVPEGDSLSPKPSLSP